MVSIIKVRVSQKKDGKPFVSLKIQGEPEITQSLETGRFYLTARTCYITTTFDEATANSLIGKELPGTVVRVPCEPYQYTKEDTGEVSTLCHRYEYRMNPVPETLIPQPISTELEVYDELA
jgi:hypothetical protein